MKDWEMELCDWDQADDRACVRENGDEFIRPFCFGDYEWDSSDECQGCSFKAECEKPTAKPE